MRRALLISVVLSALLAACGGAPDEAPRTATGPAGSLPSTRVTDLRDGSTLSLASLSPQGRPLLVWFWAPY